MDPDGSEIIEMVALGRPFNLGMLYDCRADKLVPGITLWDREKLDSDMRVTPKPNTEFNIVTSELISDKASSLGVDASLKASFYSGLVNVEGSAKYLNDNKTSKKQARVTLHYKTTTQFKELTMNQLRTDNIKHHNVTDKGIATHVVTAILYGAQAFFVFDREASYTENLQDIQGNLKMLISIISTISIEGEWTLKFRALVNRLSCTFHGDFCLEQSPTTFKDAVKVYQDLPKLLGPDGEKAVPVKVWLLPLTTLDSQAARLVRQISLRLVLETQDILEDFSDLEMRCNDVLTSTAAQQFPQMSKKIKHFMALCSEFRLGLQGTLAKKLPAIRGGGEEEAELAEILKKGSESPFNSNRLNQWMDSKVQETNVIKSLTNMMNTEILSSQSDLINKVFSREKAVVFVFTSLERAEPYLSELEKYLKGVQSDESDPRAQEAEKKPWYGSKDVVKAVRHKAKLFSDFAEANKDDRDIRFLAVGLTDKNHKDSTIYLYEDGFQDSDNFEPPSKPGAVTVGTVTHNSVTLTFSAPSDGAEAVTGYRVEYCVSGKKEWKDQTEPKVGEVTVTDLSLNTEYSFRVRAITDVGVGPASVAKGPIKTLPCSPPGEPEGTATSSEVAVHWNKPNEVGQGVQILKYIVEYGQTENRIQWKQEESVSEELVISGLQPQTSYTVRVRCDCGKSGTSKESSPVTISTTSFTRPAELLRRAGVKINSAIPTIYKLPLKEQDLGVAGCRFNVLGEECQRKNLNIMLLGSVGAGKTTLINGMINYILGVQWTDSYRFKLTEDNETTETTVYKINHQDGFQIDYSLTIIDTPGCGDSRGIERVREITEQIFNLFSSDFGVSDIHAVCFVAQSHLARLTPTQRCVFGSVLSIFGKDVAENIRILVTFADGQRPPVLQAFTDAGVPCPQTEDGLPAFYKFNNSALFAPNQTSADDFDEMFWNMRKASMKSFFDALDQTEPKSLSLTKEVLRERKKLEQLVECLEKQVKVGLAKLDEINETEEQVKKHVAETERNKNFEIEVTVTQPFQVNLSGRGNYITNCQVCHYTCHDPCTCGNDEDKRKCEAMGPDENCKVCPGKCHWTLHFNQKYKWEYKQVTQKMTVEELKQKYLKATEQKKTVEGLIEKLKKQYEDQMETVRKMIEESTTAINRLMEITLKPNPLSTPDYIDLLIEGEKSEAKPGWKQRVASLSEMKRKAEIMAKLHRGEKLLQSLNW